MMVDVDVGEEYRQHVSALAHYASVLVGPDEAMDVVNEAVAKTLSRQSLERVQDVRAYWFQAVTYTASSWHRSRSRRDARERRVGAQPRFVSDAHSDVVEDSLRVLDGLSVQQRAVVYFTYWADWPIERIAAVLDVSTGTVRKQLGRARAHLREVLIDERA
jgi:RNA polymerase sigma factor (sigma-70 family)